MPEEKSGPAGGERGRRSMGRVRFETGTAVLFAAMGSMLLLALLDVFFTMSSDLVNSAFEAFKLIAVTVLGYIFGANHTKTDQD